MVDNQRNVYEYIMKQRLVEAYVSTYLSTYVNTYVSGTVWIMRGSIYGMYVYVRLCYRPRTENARDYNAEKEQRRCPSHPPPLPVT